MSKPVLIKSVVTGTVIQVLVESGRTVQPGQTVVLLESMKLEIPIAATAAGTLRLRVAEGQIVETDEILATVEAA